MSLVRSGSRDLYLGTAIPDTINGTVKSPPNNTVSATPPRLSVLMPAYNEQERIEAALDEVLASPLAEEIIVIDDGSSDTTAQLVAARIRTEGRLRMVSNGVNQGKGYSLMRAISLARGHCFVIHDCDNEYGVEPWAPMLADLESNQIDFAIGNRFTEGLPGLSYPLHSLFNLTVSGWVSWYWRTTIGDVECCTKMGRTVQFCTAWRERRFGIEIEMAAWAVAQNMRIRNYPVDYHPRSYREGKKIGWRDGIAALVCLARYNPGRLRRFKNKASG